MEDTKKINKAIVVVIILLIVVILSLIGYIIYEKIESDKKAKNSNSITTSTTTTEKKNTNKLSDNEIEEYLSYVPFEEDSIYKSCTWETTENDCQSIDEWKDAYTENQISNSEISDDLLLRVALNHSNVLDSSKLENESNKICDKNIDYCNKGQFYKVNEVLDFIYKVYNRKIQPKSFHTAGGKTYYENEYFITIIGMGNEMCEKINKVNKVEMINDELIIYEKAMFIYNSNSSKDGIPVIAGKPNYLENDIIKKYEDSNIDFSVLEEFAESNIDKGFLYKHTFKLNENNKYYWYSTELIN